VRWCRPLPTRSEAATCPADAGARNATQPKPKKNRQDRRPKPAAAGGRPRRGRPKFCVFCRDHATWVDYKEGDLLRRFITERGRIKARGSTGACAQHQRDVATAVETARELALLPYSVRTVAVESRGVRGGTVARTVVVRRREMMVLAKRRRFLQKPGCRRAKTTTTL
jgi:small subunit ribosomal protein S18